MTDEREEGSEPEHPQRSPLYKAYRRVAHEDERLRYMFNRAEYDPDTDVGVQKFADNMRFVRERQDTAIRRRSNRTRFLIWLSSGLGLAVIGLAATWLEQWVRVRFP